jgi:hypothetical protein
LSIYDSIVWEFFVEEVERNLSVVFELRSVRSIYALERSEELRFIRPSRVNARVWKLGQSWDKPYGGEEYCEPFASFVSVLYF